MYSKSQIRVTSFLGAIIFIGIFSIVLSNDGKMAVLLFDRNTTEMVYPFTIQNAMWLMFFIGLGELYYRHQVSKADVEALTNKYLLEEMGLFYDQATLTNVMSNVHDKNNRLADLIKSLFMRYQASQKSPDETHQMLNSQLEMMQFKLDVDYNMIRYLSWLIPTLGFIGTVVGISQALSYAGIPGTAESEMFLPELTTKLAVAFNTTLVALIMSAVLVYIMHLMQGREESVIQHCGEYCLNNFINKLISK